MPIQGLSKFVLICLFGSFFALSARGYDFWFLAWFCLAPLFLLIKNSKGLKEAVIYSFLFGFFYNILYLWWLFSLHPLNWLGFSSTQSYIISLLSLLITSLYSSIFYILFGIIAFYFYSFFSNIKGASFKLTFILSFIWLIIFNKLQFSKFILGFPWTLVEYSQYKNLFLIQASDCFGGALIAFLIVFFNLVIADIAGWFFNIQKISNRLFFLIHLHILQSNSVF